jgi:hypothetical protein
VAAGVQPGSVEVCAVPATTPFAPFAAWRWPVASVNVVDPVASPRR